MDDGWDLGLMRQLALELNGYPRPIAWTLSEVERAIGDRDRHNMLLTALEEITRYLVMIQLARYTEYWAQGRGSQEVEQELTGLRRPSFGHYVNALRVLDDYLARANDPYAIQVAAPHKSHAMLRFLVETGSNAKKASTLGFLGRVVELRNQAKGHGYTDQQGARAVIEYLQPALTELLNHMPLLIARPLVWVERIEYIDVKRWVVTLLELMGTQRARQQQREVQEPGNLKKGFLYMWDGESSPLQLTPFLHLEQVAHDELVYVLAGFSGEPVYQARGSADARRRPDQLLSQLEERAPFLLKSAPTTTTARPPDAARFYRHAVEVALADGVVSPAEAARLEAMRVDLGLLAGEAAVIHAELGWTGEVVGEASRVQLEASGGPRRREESSPSDDASPPARGMAEPWRGVALAMLEAVRAAIADGTDGTPPTLELDLEGGELHIQVGATQVVSVRVSSKRGSRVRVVVGFCSTRKNRDPMYRKARKLLETTLEPQLEDGWRRLSRSSDPTELVLETFKRVAIVELDSSTVVASTAGTAVTLCEAATRALAEAAVSASASKGAEALEERASSASSLDDFPLTLLEGAPRIQGSVWKARILWALEWARRHDPTPKSAADIAKILTEHGVQVPGTNTARAFRTEQDDPRAAGLVEQGDGQCYTITEVGRRALFELLTATSG